jgi:hypothetical protein
MTEKKTNELDEILKILFDVEDRVKKIDVLPNWEKKVKRDLLCNIRMAALYVGDLIE